MISLRNTGQDRVVSDEKVGQLRRESKKSDDEEKKKDKKTEIRKLGFMAPLPNHKGVNERGNAALIAMDSHNCYD